MLRKTAPTLLALLRLRLELAGLEIQDEADRLVRALALMLAGALLVCFGVAFAALAVTVLLWETQRVAVLAVAACIFLLVSAVLLGCALRSLQRRPGLFAASADQIERDRRSVETP